MGNISNALKKNASLMGRGQNLERPKCRTADISEFRNLEYNNESRVIRFFYFRIYFYFYDFLNYSDTQNTYTIIYHQIRNFWKFDSFTK